VGVLLGGPRTGIRINEDYAQQLADRLLARQHKEGGSVMVLASRRTPAAVIAVFRRRMHGIPGLIWASPSDGSNPYPGVLGWADRLVVTPDSVNMLSEACAVGCTVQTWAPARLPSKIAYFHQSLRDAGLLHDLDNEPALPQPPLRETEAIAEALRQRIVAAQDA
jgi:mitochondrial fission protein ELM1